MSVDYQQVKKTLKTDSYKSLITGFFVAKFGLRQEFRSVTIRLCRCHSEKRNLLEQKHLRTYSQHTYLQYITHIRQKACCSSRHARTSLLEQAGSHLPIIND